MIYPTSCNQLISLNVLGRHVATIPHRYCPGGGHRARAQRFTPEPVARATSLRANFRGPGSETVVRLDIDTGFNHRRFDEGAELLPNLVVNFARFVGRDERQDEHRVELRHLVGAGIAV